MRLKHCISAERVPHNSIILREEVFIKLEWCLQSPALFFKRADIIISKSSSMDFDHKSLLYVREWPRLNSKEPPSLPRQARANARERSSSTSAHCRIATPAHESRANCASSAARRRTLRMERKATRAGSVSVAGPSRAGSADVASADSPLRRDLVAASGRARRGVLGGMVFLRPIYAARKPPARRYGRSRGKPVSSRTILLPDQGSSVPPSPYP